MANITDENVDFADGSKLNLAVVANFVSAE